ncbi:alpha-2-HS-glycoprotein 2 [Hoplias malabaricus]|uniref:alpha-2-HS-glycoprotein 2 n=1 Tax=Hoplias malabaricus TaxID=27720 RepID=UPI003462C008
MKKLQEMFAVLGFLAFLAFPSSDTQLLSQGVVLPRCDSPEAQVAANTALDYINGQQTHGYKYTLNQIEDIKISARPDGTEIYVMELEFLETKCHVLDPTPAALCPVRPKPETAIEADCDVALSKSGGVLSVIAFKCKTETETPDFPCVGCPYLIPFSNPDGAQLVKASLDTFNKDPTLNSVFTLLEVGRVSAQVVSGGHRIVAEYAIIETNCTTPNDVTCVPLNHTVARQGFCHAEGVGLLTTVNCKLFVPEIPLVDVNANLSDPLIPLAPPAPPVLHAHKAGPGFSPDIHGLNHHKMTTLHDPFASGLLPVESAESLEAPVGEPIPGPVGEPIPGPVGEPIPVVPIDESQPLPIDESKPIVKRQAIVPAPPPGFLPVLPRCPSVKVHF